VLLRHYLEAGLTKTGIAERLGLDRSTIHRWIRAGTSSAMGTRRRSTSGPHRPPATASPGTRRPRRTRPVPPAECGIFNRRFCGIFNRR
jgi:transposase-like protein